MLVDVDETRVITGTGRGGRGSPLMGERLWQAGWIQVGQVVEEGRRGWVSNSVFTGELQNRKGIS